jgi:carbamoyl-phosphate synthase large subunit
VGEGLSRTAERSDHEVAVLLTGVGKRWDIVSSFARHAWTIAADPSPLAPAQYAAHRQVVPPRIEDPAYVPFLQDLVREERIGAVVPLTDLDIHVLAAADLPAFVPAPEVCAAMYDKFRCHELLLQHGLPSPPTVLPGEEPASYPVIVKPRAGSGARSIHLARDGAEQEFFVGYVDEPVMVQRFMAGPEFSIDCLCDLDGRCLNAIPRSMLESRGGESIKGQVLDDPELRALAVRVTETLGFRGPSTIQVFRDPEIGIAITDVNPRFGGAFPAPASAARPGRTYPELIVRMAAGERIEPHVGDHRHGHFFTRFYEQLLLDGDRRFERRLDL